MKSENAKHHDRPIKHLKFSEDESVNQKEDDLHEENNESDIEQPSLRPTVKRRSKTKHSKTKQHKRKASKAELNQSLVNESESADNESEEDESMNTKTVKVNAKKPTISKKRSSSIAKPTKKACKDLKKIDISFAVDSPDFGYTAYPLVKRQCYEYIYAFLCLASCGLLNLLNYWTDDRIFVWMVFRKETSLENSSHVFLKADGQRNTQSTDVRSYDLNYRRLEKRHVYISDKMSFDSVAFIHNFILYFFDQKSNTFKDLHKFASEHVYAQIGHKAKLGLLESQVEGLRVTLGENAVKIPFNSIFKKLREFAYTPMIGFEIMAIGLLYYNQFYVYGALLTLAIGGYLAIEIERRSRLEKILSDSVDFNGKVMVVRKTPDGIDKKNIIDSSDLVIGDLIEVTNNLTVPADLILVSGSCVVRETNDYSTKTKFALGTMGIDNAKNSLAVLEAGSHVIYTVNDLSEACFGIVVNTGLGTKRGLLLREKLHKSLDKNKYSWKLALVFCFCVLVLAGAAAFYYHEKVVLRNLHINFKRISDKFLEICLVLLNPLIPIVFLLVLQQSYYRLRKIGVDLRDIDSIRLAGRMQEALVESSCLTSRQCTNATIVLNSTFGVNDVDSAYLSKQFNNINAFAETAENDLNAKRLCEAFTLTALVSRVGGELFGAEEEIQMIKNSPLELRYKLGEDNKTDRFFVGKTDFKHVFDCEYRVKKVFNTLGFSKSVIVETSKGDFYLYAKADPVDIQTCCLRESISYNFITTLTKFAEKGQKISAFAYKKIGREDLESPVEILNKDLSFLGLISLDMMVCDNNINTIKTLTKANIKLNLAADCSVHEAVSLARQSGIIEHDTRILIGSTESLNGIEKLVWALLEPQLSGQESGGISENMVITEIEGKFGFDVLDSTENVALTGKALDFILERGSYQLQSSIISRCRIFGNIEEKHRAIIIKELRKRQSGTVGYIFNTSENADAIDQAHVSIAIKPMILHSPSLIVSSIPDFDILTKIFQEGRVAMSNLTQNVDFILFFIVIQFIGLIILNIKGTVYGRYQLLFLHFFVLLGFGILQAEIKPVKLNKQIPDHRMLTPKFIFKVIISTLVGGLIILGVEIALWKTKFYRNPLQLASASKVANADNAFFYDPFCVFVVELFVCLAFVVSSNRSSFFKKDFFNEFGLTVYWSVLMFFGFYLLIVHWIPIKLGYNEFLYKTFVIPSMFGFEFIIMMAVPFIMCLVFLTNISRGKIYKLFARMFSKKSETQSVNQEPELAIISQEKDKLDDSHIERKSNSQSRKSKSKDDSKAIKREKKEKVKPVKKSMEKLSSTNKSKCKSSHLESIKSESSIEKKEKKVSRHRRRRIG